MLLTSQNTYNQPLAEPQSMIQQRNSSIHSHTHPFIPKHHKTAQKHNQPHHLLPPSLPSSPPPSNHQPLIHTQPTPLAVPLHPLKSILHHQNNPETMTTQSAASKGKETDSLNCLALHSELLNNFRCILSYISMSNSCNLCFSLCMIG